MNDLTPQKSFIIGSEWIYYKIYCGVNTADFILTDTIHVITSKLLDTKIIDKWFFIRYKDPEFHLRFRLHATDNIHVGAIIAEIYQALRPLITEKLIWNINTDTYTRELDRYGEHTIDTIEWIFYYDSVMLLQAINKVKTDEQRLLFILKATYELLDSFKLNEHDKLTFVDIMKSAFKSEFRANKVTSKQLAAKYKIIQKEVETFLSPPYFDDELVSLNIIIVQRSNDTKVSINDILRHQKNNTLHTSLRDLLASLIHMSINRAFRSKQRQHEMIVYDFLSKFLKTKIAKNNA